METDAVEARHEPAPPPRGLRRQATRGLVWVVANVAATQIASTIAFIILARLLTPREFGVVALTSVFITVAELFVEGGFAKFLIQRRTLEPRHVDTAFWLNTFDGLLLSLMLVAASPLIASMFNEPALAPVSAALSISVVLTAVRQVPEALFHRQLKFRALALRGVFASVVGAAVGIGMALSGFGVWSLVGQLLAQDLASTVLLWRLSDWRPTMRFSRADARELLTFSKSVIGNRMLVFANRRLPPVLIGAFLGTTAVGLFALSARLSEMTSRLLSRTVTQLTLPIFSRLQDHRDRILSGFYQVTRVLSLVTFPMFIAPAVLANELVIVLFGRNWAAAVPAMRFLMLAGLIRSLGMFNGQVAVSLGRPDLAFRWSLIRTIVAAALVLVASRFSVTAVAAAMLAAAVIMLPYGRQNIKDLVGLSERKYFRQLVGPIVASAAMIIVLLAIRMSPMWQAASAAQRLAIDLPAAIIAYVATLRLVAAKELREFVELTRSVLRGGRKRARNAELADDVDPMLD
jgi:O-antigen/teichoic acid export membrane protein